MAELEVEVGDELKLHSRFSRAAKGEEMCHFRDETTMVQGIVTKKVSRNSGSTSLMFVEYKCLDPILLYGYKIPPTCPTIGEGRRDVTQLA